MKKEIKFKAWDKKNKGWIQGFNLFSFHDYYTKGIEPSVERYNTKWKLSDINLLQYIGIEGKDGVSIYDGDIFISEGTRFKVYRDKASFKAVSNVGDKYGPYYFNLSLDSGHNLKLISEIEVIGNINQFPELFEAYND